MTHSEARKLAVEAAASEWRKEYAARSGKVIFKATARTQTLDLIAAYERAMADAGWRMARVPVAFPSDDQLPPGEYNRDGARIGWNACRAAMLEDANG